MADEGQQIRGINWRETFAFTHLFRAFRIAIHPSKLILGLVALLALYIGGRILDGIWPAQHLAVSPVGDYRGEVAEYERLRITGQSSAEFLRDRRRARAEIENDYADRLMGLGIVTDRTKALEAARGADYLPQVKRKLLENRDREKGDAKKQYDAAWAATSGITDSAAQRRARAAATEAYEARVQAAYREAYLELSNAKLVRGVGLFHAFFSYEAQRVVGVVKGVARGNWLGRGDGAPSVVDSIIGFFTIGPLWLMRHHPVYFVLFTLWFLTIWAIFGGGIARIAAVHVARDEKLSVRAALSFSIGKFLSFVSAPLIPLVIVLFVGLLPIVAGFFASIPFIGPIFNLLMGALFILILAAGFVMTLVLLGTFGGFNLMYPTIAVEGSDSFDAISRSFSYVYARPWRMLFYTLVAVIYGALTYLFVRLFIWLMLTLSHSFVGAGMFADAPSTGPLWSTMWPGPGSRGTLSYDIDFLTLRGDQDLAAVLVAFWVYLVVSMLGAFAISFYFTANTIIYYLMRREVDATEMDDVYLEQADEEFSELTGPPTVSSGGAEAAPATTPAGTAPAGATGAGASAGAATTAGASPAAPTPPTATSPEVGDIGGTSTPNPPPAEPPPT